MEYSIPELTDYPGVDFKGDCNEASGDTPKSATSTGMNPFQQATVNAGPVSNCVIGNDEAKVFNIWVTEITGLWKYRICVDGQGPKGLFSGNFWLAFTDESGDTYHLKIFLSRRAQHTVDYNSDKPKIMKIWWCDKDFDVKSSKTNRPDYRITSPALE